MSALPDGWDIDRLRARTGCDVEVLSRDRQITLDVHGECDGELTATCVLSFGGLCLLRAAGKPEWYMGQLSDDGSISCWGAYGTDLDEAIDAL